MAGVHSVQGARKRASGREGLWRSTGAAFRYTKSEKPADRRQLAEEIQRAILENYYFVPVFRRAFMNAIGPRIVATKWQDVFQSSISTGYAYPWEDIKLKA